MYVPETSKISGDFLILKQSILYPVMFGEYIKANFQGS